MAKVAKDTVVKDVVVAAAGALKRVPAPALPYEPRDPKSYRPSIGMIACGGITAAHLGAYKKAGYNVVALCDLVEERAKARRDEYFPDATITTDHRKILCRKDIQVVDIATHPAQRVPIVEEALKAGKHVLSQKPFVLDIPTGKRLVQLAKQNSVVLAVNQNGRWAPHLSYMREAVTGGYVGEVESISIEMHWDHTWTKGTEFEKVEDLILYDFAIHWFDFVGSLLPDRLIKRVYASKSRTATQDLKVPLLAQALVEFDGGQASLVFDGAARFGQRDSTTISGSAGSLISTGPALSDQEVRLFTSDGVAVPDLKGTWFAEGFHGTMGALLCAIEEGRAPLNSADDNLRSLELAFTAIASANEGRPFNIGEVTKLWTPAAKK